MKNPPDAIMARWFLLIQEFHSHVRHIPGKTNILADLLSSAGCPADAVKSEIPEDEILVESLCAIEATLTKNNENTLYVNSPFQIAELTNTDQENNPVEKRPKRKWNKQIVPPSDRQLRPRT